MQALAGGYSMCDLDIGSACWPLPDRLRIHRLD